MTTLGPGGPGWSPLNVLPEAIKRVPALRYALGALGLLGCVAAALGYFNSPKLALIGAVAGLAVMCLMLIFSKLADLKEGFQLPAMVFLWVCLLLFITWAGCMTTSVFFGFPLKMSLFAEASEPSKPTANAQVQPHDYGQCPVGGTRPSEQMNRLHMLVENKEYRAAAACLGVFRAQNASGVYFSAYPDFVLAFDGEHDRDMALQLLVDLKHQVVNDAEKGSGWFSGLQSIGWLREKLVAISSKVQDSAVRDSLASVLTVVDQTSAELAKRSITAALDRGEAIDGRHITNQDLTDLREYVVQRVDKGSYEQALRAMDALRHNNDSHVNATVFPPLALALDRTGAPERAVQLLDELMVLVQGDMRTGHGYYSREEQRRWTISSLEKYQNSFTHPTTKERVATTINAMQTGNFPPSLSPLPL